MDCNGMALFVSKSAPCKNNAGGTMLLMMKLDKRKNKDLTQEEAFYNSTFGSFRSQMESLFADLGSTFEKHNNRAPVLVDKKQTYNLQLKLSLLLLNMKKMVALLAISVEPIHTAWLREGFEYPTTENDVEQPMEYVDVGALMEDGNTMAKLQEEFLALELHDDVDENQYSNEYTPMDPPVIL
ncbi:hypothetical protein KI688_001749 [Linnemannia hyalina]|uniref:Uncharacterized protein n=1 Tax=Linnemannia hyalina TaxID=64524 RepID=A0A9P7XQU8_9FUNG|nr:hypothetical protein KI688_001749 [Linnemannia hyalina]